jgi:hypothetical protein
MLKKKKRIKTLKGENIDATERSFEQGYRGMNFMKNISEQREKGGMQMGSERLNPIASIN